MIEQTRLLKFARVALARPSAWRVFLAIVGSSVDGDAVLQISDLISITGLSRRSVSAAIKQLIAVGLVVRVGRVGRFTIPILVGPEIAGSRCSFSPKQEATIKKAIREIGSLLCCDPDSVRMPDSDAAGLGFEPGITFVDAYAVLKSDASLDRAFDFVGCLLAFRFSETVWGTRIMQSN